MNITSINSAPSSETKKVADAVVQRLHQLPLQTQQQVLDYVEFLLERHYASVTDQTNQAELKAADPLWDAAMDEDWLALKTELSLEKS